MLASRSIVLAAFVALAVGCTSQSQLEERPGSFSTVFYKFDPAGEFAEHGFAVETAKGVAGRINPQEMYGWKPLQGSLQLSDTSTGCKDVAQAVYEALLTATRGACRDELTPLEGHERGQPFYGMLRYEKDDMRGHVYVWLFPDKSETRINYAILIHEERANDIQSPTTLAMKAGSPAI